MTSVTPVSIKVSDLNVAVSSGKRLLNDINLEFKAGSLTALMGGSGSSKTSLLNVLAGRFPLPYSGEILFNGGRKSGKIGYCQQNDYLLPYLTVKETLFYSARLLVPGLERADYQQLVTQVMHELDLSECADTIIGDSLQRGVSGGQRRRTSVAIQCLQKCSVIFLDECTSGLDAYMALHLVQVLKRLAVDGHTIVMSIHQPRRDIFDLLDNVVLLSQGSLCYAGATTEVASYFDSLGLKCPVEQNIADFIVDCSSIDSTSPLMEEQSQVRVKMLTDQWKQSQLDKVTHADSETDTKKQKSLDAANKGALQQQDSTKNHRSFIIKFFDKTMILTSRGFVNLKRDFLGTFGMFMADVLIAVLMGLIFYQLPVSADGIRSRAGAAYAVSGLKPYLYLILDIYRLSDEMRIFDRERKDSFYGVCSYLTSSFIVNFLPRSLSHVAFTTIMFFLTDLRPVFGWIFFMRYTAVNLMHSWLLISMAWAAISISRDFSVSSLIANTFVSFLTLSCGFFINTADLPVYVAWIRYISSFWYTYRASLSAALTDVDFASPGDGNAFLLTQESEPNYFGDAIWHQALIWLTTASVCVILLHVKVPQVSYKNNQVKHKSTKVHPLESSLTGNQQPEVQKVVEIDEIRKAPLIVVRNLSLRVQKFREQKIILRDVSTQFQPGQLNVILGSSGSGKSSLLNTLAGRLHSNSFNRFVTSGSIDYIIDNKKIRVTNTQMKRFISYVTQFDDRLLPSLTVRETLTFAAMLRMPSAMSTENKRRRVEELIQMLGLKECADTFVGNEFIKGISGGQARRLSIAIQLLMDPYVLLLDECTTGLDAFNARNVMLLLKQIASGELTGRQCTVICTIHQPQSEIYTAIDNILLLAKGSQVIYSGSRQEMLPFFESNGHQCPEMTNPADFVLDVSVQHRGEFKVSAADSATVTQYQESAINNLDVSKPSDVSLIPTLLKRSYLNIFRQSSLVIARLSQVVAFGAVLTLNFAPLRDGQSSIQTRFGVIQEHLALQFVGLLNNLAVYPQQRNSFYEEYEEGVVGTLAFQLVYLLTELPFEILSSMIFVLITDYAGGFQMDVPTFFKYSLVALTQVSVGESVGIIFCTFFMHSGIAVSFTNLILSLLSFLSGIVNVNIAVVWNYINKVTPTFYGAQVMVQREFDNITFTCTDSELLTIPLPGGDVLQRCPIQNGREALEAYNLDQTDYSIDPLIALVVCLVAYRVLACVVMLVVMRFRK
ncbi:hypothetical protein MIR68_010900 [Amoeboaphelidium protococcarum]|nr:hypothetical protein MIR68_010900 [Amoeboaphelidium protococcarum]